MCSACSSPASSCVEGVTSWLDTLSDAGALRPVAQRFIARFHQGECPPRGIEGLLALSAAIDRFAEEGEPSDDDAFLEGAGALLGAIVIAAHPGRARHVSAPRASAPRVGAPHATAEQKHRIELGGRGFFDPFAAVAQALTGEIRARKVLAAELARVEAELRGEGPIARVSRAFDEALSSERPELSVVHRFDREVVLSDETRVDLTKAIEATEGASGAAVALAAKKLVDMLPGGRGAVLPLEEALPRLFPRLLGPSFQSDTAVHAVPFRGALRVALIARFDDRARFVVTGDLARWAVDPDALLLRALDNLALASAKARVHVEAPLLSFRTGDGLDSARLLLPGLHETLAGELGARFLAAVPHRDVLWLASSEHVAALEARALDDHARAPHRISPELYAVTAEGVSPFV